MGWRAGRPAEASARYGGVQNDNWHTIDTSMHDAHYLYGSYPQFNATTTIVCSHVYGVETPTEVQGNASIEIAF